MVDKGVSIQSPSPSTTTSFHDPLAKSSITVVPVSESERESELASYRMDMQIRSEDHSHALDGPDLDADADLDAGANPAMDIPDKLHDNEAMNETLETTDENSDSDSSGSIPNFTGSSDVLDEDMFDSELDAAVRNALQSVDVGSHSDYNDDDDEYDDDSSLASSIASNANSINSVKSAVQLRLEGRKKPEAPSKQSFDAKLEAASQRKLFFLQAIASKRRERLDKVSSARTLVEDQHELEVSQRKKSLHEKLSLAAQRKDYFLDNKTDQVRMKNNKASMTKSILDQRKDAEAAAIAERMEHKLRSAEEKKELNRLKLSEKMQAKISKISNTKESAELHLREMGLKIAEKMASASSRKLMLDSESKGKVEGHLNKRQEYAMSVQKSKEANVSNKKMELDSKIASASERKQALLEAKTSKVSEYLTRAYERGQEAIKRKEEMSLNGEEPEDPMLETSLRSIKEEPPIVARDVEIDDDMALQWLDDENSVASFSTAGSSKSRVQERLEGYRRSEPSREAFDSKLEAAQKRRELALSAAQNKAGFSAKMEKASNKLQHAEAKIAAMSKHLSEKMNAASERRTKHLNDSIRGKAMSKSIRLEKAKDKQAEKDAKVSELQKNLEKKLLAALERKEAIVSSKAAKASGDISVCSSRRRSALEKKEITMLKIQKKAERRMDTASKRRKQLRALENKKKEVMMMRREMTKSINADEKLLSMQQKLSKKLSSAQERKEMFIQAKKAKAATYRSSVNDRGEEVTRGRETEVVQNKTELELKLEAATKRKEELEAKAEEKRQMKIARRERAKVLGQQRRLERANISNWEDESLSPPSVANAESGDLEDVDIDDVQGPDSHTGEQENGQSTGSYEERRLQAKQQIMSEMQLANEAKRDEFVRITNEMKHSKKPRAVRAIDRDASLTSAQSFGTIDTNEQLSFDEGENVSISGLSTVREEQENIDRRKAQTALALAELDVKLSEIQLMQAILLAEEASLCGKNEFKTTDQSVDDLSRAKGAEELMKQKRSQERKDALKKRAKQFFQNTLTQAKLAKQKAGKTIEKVKFNIEKHERMNANIARPSTAPSASTSVF